MDFDRNSMTVPMHSSDYTNNFLQKDSNPTTWRWSLKPIPSSLRLTARKP